MRVGRGTRRSKFGALSAAVLASLALAVTGCSSISRSGPSTTMTHARSHSTLVNTTNNPPTTIPVADYPATTGKVEIYVRTSPTRVVTDGHPFTIDLVLVNGLGHPFGVPGPCSGWLAAGLTSATVSFHPAYSAVGCARDTVHPGENRLSRTVTTTYESCSENLHVTATADFPDCVGPDHEQLPSLPAGQYHLKLDTASVPHAILATPVTVTLAGP